MYGSSYINDKRFTPTNENGKQNRLYRAWHSMKQRCGNKNNVGYKRYGGKGITVCETWANNYWEFCKWAIQNGFKDGLTLDRINNSKGYYPENCRWATYAEQSDNRDVTKWVTYKGETKLVKEWAKELGMSYDALYARLYVYGWSVEMALTKPLKKRGTRCD